MCVLVSKLIAKVTPFNREAGLFSTNYYSATNLPVLEWLTLPVN
mgnify:CR=1 FL=1